MTVEEKYTVAFSVFTPIGPKRSFLLRKYFGSAQKAWQAPEKDLLGSGLPEGVVRQFVNFRQSFDLSSYLLRLAKLGVKTTFFGDKIYPEHLKGIDGPPVVLYTLGEFVTGDALAIGVVGTRTITAYGKEVTESLVTDLTASGLTIVSGLAYGVDCVAHTTALNTGGRTIGVWAGGLDTVLSGFRQNLVRRMVDLGKGVVVSEFPLGFHPTRTTFPQRNRIISGLSLGVLVTEAAEDSGSLITARHAFKQGRKVFAVPGPITSSLSKGTAELIKKGAKLVYQVSDILEELDIGHDAKCIKAREVLPESKEEELILGVLQNENKHIDEIIRETGLEPAKAISLLTLMEMRGKVKNLGGMIYGISR